MQELHKRNHQRKEHVKSICAKYGILPTSYHAPENKNEFIYVDDKNQLLYCAIPKVTYCNKNWEIDFIIFAAHKLVRQRSIKRKIHSLALFQG